MSTEKKQAASSNNLTAALAEAQSILEAAELRAKQLTFEAERTYEEALQRGYQEGVEKGRREAVEQAVRLVEETTAVADRLAEEAARLAIAIASSVVGAHVSISPESAKAIAINAIQESVIGDSVTLVVHPDDQQMIESSLPEIRRIAGGAGVSVETDESLTRGGCIVRTEFGEIDASIETLIGSIKERLGLSNG